MPDKSDMAYADIRGLMEMKGKNGYVKLWQFIIGLVITLASIFIYVGAAMNRLDSIEKYQDRFEVMREQFIEMKTDIRYMRNYIEYLQDKERKKERGR